MTLLTPVSNLQTMPEDIPSFNSDQLVEIRDMYQDNDDVVIIYEQMDVSLRHMTGLLQGPLSNLQGGKS